MRKLISVVDIIGKEIEVYKAKVFLFTAISGASWVYAFKFDGNTLKILLLTSFMVASFGVFSNVLKLSDVENELKGLKNV